MNYEVYSLTETERKNYYMVSVTLLLLVGYLFYQRILAMALLACCCRLLESQYCQYRASKRKQLLNDQFRDFLYSIGASLSSGHQMESAVLEAEKSLRLAYDEEAIICRELAYMAQGIRESRQSAESLLLDFSRRSGIADIRQFANIYCVCKTTGADLQQVIEKTVEILLDKMNFRKEIRVITAQKRLEANVLAGTAIGMIAFLNLVSPGYLQVLYDTWQGHIIMTVAMAGIGGAYAWSMKLTELELD